MASSIIKASMSNVIVSSATTLSGLSGSGDLDASITLTPGVWALMMIIQGGSTSITRNDQRAEFSFSINYPGVNTLGASLPHNTSYPKMSLSQVMRLSTEVVYKISYYIDTSEVNLAQAKIIAQKIG